MSIQQIAGIAQRGEPDATRLAACIHLLDRGWGPVKQQLTGVDGALEIVIRNILIDVTPTTQPKVIEEKPNDKS